MEVVREKLGVLPGGTSTTKHGNLQVAVADGGFFMRHGWAAFSWQGFSGRQKKASRARPHGAPKRDGPWQGFAEKSVSLQSKFPRSKFLKCWGLRFICYTLAGIVLATEGWFGPPPSATAQQVSISTPLVGITES